jgi:hypothetical protein
MTRDIRVQAKADYIASLAHASPLAAIEELVWNALDADAREVKIDLIQNALGAVEAIRISDDGAGVDVDRIDSTFGGLGGSWKREGKGTQVSGRRLHGRHGRGRFRAFALGTHVEWRTTMRIGGDLMSYTISGDADKPGMFELESLDAGPASGTEVFITGVRAVADSLLDAAETVQNLAAKFALYLKSYPHVRIYFNGLPVTPVIVKKQVTDYKLTLDGGQEAKLEVIEWKRKFVGAGRLVFAGPDGFQLHDMPVGVRSGTGASFTAYVVSSRFPALHAENALVMDELNPEVRRCIDEVKKVLKAHFLAMSSEKTAFEVEWEGKIASLTKLERKALIEILKRSLKAK